MPEGLSPIEPKLAQDPRFVLFDELPDEIYHIEDRETREREYSARMFGLTIFPDGRIVGEPLPYYLGNDTRRLQFEDFDALKSTDPQTVQRNLLASEAITDLMHTGTTKLTEPINIPLARVSFGTSYIFNKNGEDYMTMRFNNDPNNVFCDAANPFSNTIVTLRSQTHPGDLLRQSFEEVIPAFLDNDETILPIWPYQKLNSAYYRKYAHKHEILSGRKMGENFTRYFENNPPDATSRKLLYREDLLLPFSTVQNSSPISFEFVTREGITKRQRYLSADFNPIGAIELQKTVRLPKAPDTFFDPEFGSQIAVIKLTDLLHKTREAMHDESVFTELETASPNGSLGPINEAELYDGATGTRLSQSDISNLRISPCLWADLKSMYYQSDFSKR